ncbi:hypothetical protein HS088_TW02G00915 [Tripterygium wilfordii]|uniref:Uncharacterized protein n=1 Tax=Tripterygium wilfordii TaxID=458696 RepID=A0A7J7E0Q4_TRIWF|nr:hypothetical protein HS088_TW02G00915 [Tripterygium wilfordii]
MVRLWKEAAGGNWGGDGEGLTGGIGLFWTLLVILYIVGAIIFSCADGASRDKASATNADAYGSTCAAGCGAACAG